MLLYDVDGCCGLVGKASGLIASSDVTPARLRLCPRGAAAWDTVPVLRVEFTSFPIFLEWNHYVHFMNSYVVTSMHIQFIYNLYVTCMQFTSK